MREASDASGHGVGIFADLQGPKIRLGKFADGPVTLEDGRGVHDHHARRRRATRAICSTTYEGLPGDVSAGRPDPDRRRQGAPAGDRGRRHRRRAPGSSSAARSATTRASTCPASRCRVPALSEKDIEDLRWALHLDRRLHRAVVRALGRRRRGRPRRSCARRACCLPVIAKIEKPQAIDNLDEIVDAFDGVHGRPRRPRRGVPARGRAVPAEAGHRARPAATPSR